MRFELVDRIIEQTADRIVTIKAVSAAEEYLADHFPTFPVLPGVMMLESMVQAGRRLAGAAGTPEPERPLVLGKVRALKYGRFVKPGSFLRVEVSLLKPPNEGEFEFRGEATVIEPGDGGSAGGLAAAGRFSLRPARLPAGATVGEAQLAE